VLPIALVLAPIALIVVPLLTDLVEPKRVERFARRQGLVLTPSNGDRVLTYLRVTRRWRSLGLVFRLLVLLAGFTAESITVRPLPPFLGWFADALVAEVRLARTRPAGRGGPALRLVPRAVTLLWSLSAVAAGALVCYGTARYLRFGTDATALPWAAGVAVVVAVTAAVVLGAMLAWSVPAPRSPDAVTWIAPEGREETSSRPIAHAALPECGTRLTFRKCTAWELFAVDEGPDDPRSSMMALQAATFAGKQGPLPRPAPFALSGDGFHAVYLHARTRRMVHQDLRTGVRHDLTGPLADAELPVPVLSHDGRRVALTAAGPGTGTTLLVDADGGRSAEVPGIARVLGVGPRGFTAVTVPEGDKVELITVSPDGAVRTRVPFDPGPSAGLFPDGRRVLVLTEGGEAVTVDPATGKTTRRVKIRAEFSEFGDTPELLGWDARGRFLARLDLDDADDEPRLVDPATGKTSEAEGISLNESHRFPVLGKVDPW
jgi:hypothetical protein